MSGYTQTTNEVTYSYFNASTNLATFTTEDNLMKTYPACIIPGGFFSKTGKLSSSLKGIARGQIGTTSGPTFTFSIRLIAGTDATAWSAGGILLGSTPALTAATTVTLAPYKLEFDIGLRTAGAAGSAASVLVTSATVDGAAFAAVGSMPANNTGWTVSTLDASQQYSLFISCACGTSSGSNLINMQMLKVYGEN